MSRPEKIYLEETTIGNKTGVRSTVDEGTFHNWQAVYKLMSGATALYCRYFVGTVEWTEVSGDE